ncbi:barstar family protein [Nocardiopsis gilva]|nr:barstar family protein [Nocardiopsis gilva]
MPRSLPEFRDELTKLPSPPREVHLTGWGEFAEKWPEHAEELRGIMVEHRDRNPETVVTYTDSPAEISTVIDLGGVADARDLHLLLKQALDFPWFYGKNWDAFWDAITGLVELPAAIRFTGWRHLEAVSPRDARMLRQCLDDYLAESTRDGEHVTVVYGD